MSDRSVSADFTMDCPTCGQGTIVFTAGQMEPHGCGYVPPSVVVDCEATDELYLRLKGARESLCRAQVLCASSADRTILQAALDRIDLVGYQLPQWSRFDRPDAPPDVVG